MTKIGFHAPHEQFPPSELLALVKAAEAAGFDCAMSSDHFKPWGPDQGHSGFAWSWLGAAMEATKLSFGVISAPGYRNHREIGFSELQLHQVGRHQQAFIEAFGSKVLPQLR